MGLDITAYQELTPATDVEVDQSGEPVDWEGHFFPYPQVIRWTEEYWPGRTEGVAPGVIYDFADSFDFRAGSYSGYSAWRNELAKLAGFQGDDHYWRTATPEAPFYELINFADNEGVIGPKAATALLEDFTAFAEKVSARGEYFQARYAEWKRACEMASQNGAIDFH